MENDLRVFNHVIKLPTKAAWQTKKKYIVKSLVERHKKRSCIIQAKNKYAQFFDDNL